MKRPLLKAGLLLSPLLSPSLVALEIEFRYNVDTSGFFDQPGAKEALEAAGKLYSDLIVDELEAIDPENFISGQQFHWWPSYLEPPGTKTRVPGAEDMVVPANTIIIFAGARSLTSTAQGGTGSQFNQGTTNIAWFNHFLNRGEEGAVSFSSGSFTSNPSDMGPWGGTVLFNIDEEWNFSTTDPHAAPGIDFLPVALHEIGHVLGIGNLNPTTSSWYSLLSNSNTVFDGPFAKASNGNVAPTVVSAFHWSSNLPSSRTIDAFGRSHGETQKGIMQGTIPVASVFAVPTDLELAALRDIGWELAPASANFSVEVDLDFVEPSLKIPTSTGVNYQVNSSSLPNTLSPTGPVLEGDGTVQTWFDPLGPAERGFYRVEAFESPLPIGLSELNTKSESLKKSGTTPSSLELPDLPDIPQLQCDCHFH